MTPTELALRQRITDLETRLRRAHNRTSKQRKRADLWRQRALRQPTTQRSAQ